MWLRGQTSALASTIPGKCSRETRLRDAARPRPLHELARLLEVSAKLERLNRGEFDPDQATSIVVHIERRSEPRYKTAGWADADDGKKMDP